MTNLGKWQSLYQDSTPFPFGSDSTYRIGAEFLAGCRTIDDWGCGTQWFRGVMQGLNPETRITGLDGSAGYCDQIVDLREYVPAELPDGLILRHVLEHNFDWRIILNRALKSFTHRMILILCTPTVEQETLLYEHSFPEGVSCPYLSLPQSELEQILASYGLSFHQETIASPDSEFGHETIFRISRRQWRPIVDTTLQDAGQLDSHVNAVEEFPFVSCLCPTYGRPSLLANALACYLAQDYPADRRELIILDDAGQYVPTTGSGWELISLSRRFRSLPEKYNALAGLANGDVLAVWEDDDIYLPWHISAHVRALSTGLGYSKPSKVQFYTHERLQTDSAAGRFHASIAFRRKWLDRVPGWPLTLRGDFDQQLMSRLSRLAPVADPLETHPPSYVFRWESTGDYHGSALMVSPEDEEWYGLVADEVETVARIQLQPVFDQHTIKCFSDNQIPLPVLPIGNHAETFPNSLR